MGELTVYGLNVESFQKAKKLGSRGTKVGFFDVVRAELPDVVCLQETACSSEDTSFPPYALVDGYKYFSAHDTTAPGATGVCVLSRLPARATGTALCDHPECAGRFIEVQVGAVTVVSAYGHSHDGKSEQRHRARQRFLECLESYMVRAAKSSALIVLDANVVLSRPDAPSPQKLNGPWGHFNYRDPLNRALERQGWQDSYRTIHGRDKRRSTVWSSVESFPENGSADEGYAIDFQLASRSLKVLEAEVRGPVSYHQRFSDHASTFGRYGFEEES